MSLRAVMTVPAEAMTVAQTANTSPGQPVPAPGA